MPTITKSEARRRGYPIGSFFIQTILIPHTFRGKKRYLADNGFDSSYRRETTNYSRFMQTNPVRGAVYRSKVMDDDIILVYQKI